MKSAIKSLLLAGAVISVPVSLYAVTYLNVDGWGTIGSAQSVGSASGVLAVGLNNIISVGLSDTGTAVIGTSLRSYYPNCLVVGKYSANATGTNPLFIVGNGTGTGNDTNTRKNAVEVWGDGTVYMPQGADIKKVPARGGISMGTYTAN